jgi:hypothetical protein
LRPPGRNRRYPNPAASYRRFGQHQRSHTGHCQPGRQHAANLHLDVTPAALGEFTFAAGATSSSATFDTATSASVLVSPDGQNQFVAWNLGSNEPGTTGVSANNEYFYAFQGGSANFWTYNVANSLWNDPLNPTNSPVSIANGGALTNDGVQYIYALQGGTRVFMRYDAIANTWDNIGITDLPGTTANVVGAGGALAYLNGYVYALIGNKTNQLWRYDVARTPGHRWRTPLPESVRAAR